MQNLKKKKDKNQLIGITIVYFLLALFIEEISRTTTIFSVDGRYGLIVSLRGERHYHYHYHYHYHHHYHYHYHYHYH